MNLVVMSVLILSEFGYNYIYIRVCVCVCLVVGWPPPMQSPGYAAVSDECPSVMFSCAPSIMFDGMT